MKALGKIAIGVALLTAAMPALAQDVVQQRGSSRSDGRAPKANTSKAKPSSSDYRPAWYDQGMAAIRDKNPGKAVELMKPLLADFEKRYAGEKRQIYCAVNAQQAKTYLDDAAKASVEAVTIEPDWCRAQYVRGYALIDLGQSDDALAAFKALTALAPRNSRYLNELGYVLADKKKYVEALGVYQRALAAVTLSPDNSVSESCTAYRGIGFAQTKLGKLGEAEKAYRACLAIDPDNDEVQGLIDDLSEERKLTV